MYPHMCEIINQEGSIPVGYVPPDLVATTRCQYGSRYLIYRPARLLTPWVYLHPPDLGPEIPNPPQRRPGTRDSHHLPSRKDLRPEIPTTQKGHGPQRYLTPRGQTDTCENITFPQLRLRAVMPGEITGTSLLDNAFVRSKKSRLRFYIFRNLFRFSPALISLDFILVTFC